MKEKVSRMLISRKDIFENCSEIYFEKRLLGHTKILNKYKISESGRVIFEYEVL
jgi:hypothetical protein|tara:strand:+ start:73 stop:234 length:162 start_codon:yes stop_codon:yes gene_type:complete